MASGQRKRQQAARRMKHSAGKQQRGKAKLCETTGKRGYRDQGSALLVASRAAASFGPQRTYLCEFCGRWHLTSKPRRESR